MVGQRNRGIAKGRRKEGKEGGRGERVGGRNRMRGMRE